VSKVAYICQEPREKETNGRRFSVSLGPCTNVYLYMCVCEIEGEAKTEKEKNNKSFLKRKILTLGHEIYIFFALF
jgi:hypothetical protein